MLILGNFTNLYVFDNRFASLLQIQNAENLARYLPTKDLMKAFRVTLQMVDNLGDLMHTTKRKRIREAPEPLQSLKIFSDCDHNNDSFRDDMDHTEMFKQNECPLKVSSVRR